jgi:ATP-dependent protease HslVU (ClpYQ) peptidase subunit
MTVISFDGKSIAADKRNTWGSGTLTTTKLVRLHGGVLAGCGNTSQILEMIHWIKKGCKVSAFPDFQRDPESSVSLLMISPQGQILQYENTPHPIAIENKFWAIGSGSDYAMAAMHLGHSARRAVEVAIALDPGCGNGIDEIILFPETDA